MSDSPSFDHLLSKDREGDVDAVGEIIDRRFAARLAALAAGNISQRLGRRVGAEDVVQSVFRTFFRRLDGQGIELRDWQSLWGLLAGIAVCRICKLAKHHAAAKRSQNRETDLTPDVQAFAPEPSPAQVLIAEELHDCFLAETKDSYRPIVLGLLEGKTQEEIASEVGTSISTVQRIQRGARKRLQELLAAES